MGSLRPIAHSSRRMMKLLALLVVIGAAAASADADAYRYYGGYRGYGGYYGDYRGYGGYYRGKREADAATVAEAAPVAEADADASPYYYGGYYGYARPYFVATMVATGILARGL